MRFCRRWEIFIFHPILMGFFAFDSSQWKLSVVCQHIFSISYRFRAKRGQSSGGRGKSISFNMEKFYFNPILMGFLQMIPHKKCNKSYSKHFFVAFSDFCIKGVKGLKNANLLEMQNLYFLNFDEVFCIWFLSMRTFSSMSTDFLYLLPFSS